MEHRKGRGAGLAQVRSWADYVDVSLYLPTLVPKKSSLQVFTTYFWVVSLLNDVTNCHLTT